MIVNNITNKIRLSLDNKINNNMKNNKIKSILLIVVLSSASFILGRETISKEIHDRWENRFDSDWYHWQDVETFITGE